jgi:hypothetical protein
MGEPNETSRGKTSSNLAQSTESEPLIWNPPALTTFKIEEETLTPGVSGPE